jgi:exonuclease SbcC
MTPLSIEIEGVRSFTTSRTIDFAGLELFAIIGDTGSGKSSILEAMVYALFNGTTWDGKNVKELMSTIATRMRVRFRFELAGRSYTITRITPRAGASSHLLECDGHANERRDGDRAIAARLQELLGVDREQFIKTVVLPQGEFAALLTLDPGKRATLLADVLGLGVIDDMAKHLSNIRTRANALRAKLTGRRGAFPDDPAGALAAASDLAERVKRDEHALQKTLEEIGTNELTLAAMAQRAERRGTLTAAIAGVAPEVAALRSLRVVDDEIQKHVDENERERAEVKTQLAEAADALARGKAAGLDPPTIAASQQKLERLTGQCREHAREVKELEARRDQVHSTESAVAERSAAAASAREVAERARLGEAAAKKDADAAMNVLQEAEKAWNALWLARASSTKAVEVQALAAATLTASTAEGLRAKLVAEETRLDEAAAKSDAAAASSALHAAESAWNALRLAKVSSTKASEVQTRAVANLAEANTEASRAKQVAEEARLEDDAAKRDAQVTTSQLQAGERAWNALRLARASSTKAAEAQTLATATLSAAIAEGRRSKRSADEARLAEADAKKDAAAATNALQAAEQGWNALSFARAFSAEATQAQRLATATLAKATDEGLRAKQADDEAERNLNEVQEKLRAVERKNAAAKAAQGLTVGDPCPICLSVLSIDFKAPVADDLELPQRDLKEAESRRRKAARVHTQAEAQVQFAQEAEQKAAEQVQRSRLTLDEAMADATAAGIDLAAESDAMLNAIRQRASVAATKHNAAAEAHMHTVREHSRAEAQLEEAQKRLAEAEAEVQRSRLALDEAMADATAAAIDLTAESDAMLVVIRQRASVAEARRNTAFSAQMRAEREHSRADAQLEDAQKRLAEAQAEVQRWRLALDEAMADAAAASIDVAADSNTVLSGIRQCASVAEARSSVAAAAHLQAERERSRADVQLEDAQRRLAEAQAEVQRSRLALDEAMVNAATAGVDLAAESDAVLGDIRQRASVAEAKRSAAAVAHVQAEREQSRADAQLEDAQKGLADAKTDIVYRVETISSREREIAMLRAHIPKAYLSDSEALSKTVLAGVAVALDAAAEAAQALANANLAAIQAERSVGDTARALDLRRRLEIHRPMVERRRHLILASDALLAAGYVVPPEDDDSERSLIRAVAWSDAILQASADASSALGVEEDEDAAVSTAAKVNVAECLRRCNVVSTSSLRS